MRCCAQRKGSDATCDSQLSNRLYSKERLIQTLFATARAQRVATLATASHFPSSLGRHALAVSSFSPMATVVCPGEKLHHSSEVQAGAGTYIRDSDGSVCAALAGVATLVPPAHQDLPTAEVHRGRPAAPLPQPGSTVLARVRQVTPRLASCDIVCVNGAAVDQAFSGIIRQQDVRATEVDKVVMSDCFRPGDVVRATVWSMGDQRSYYLSTASDELGVVYAMSSVPGLPMTALGDALEDPVTRTREPRKVARAEVTRTAG